MVATVLPSSISTPSVAPVIVTVNVSSGSGPTMEVTVKEMGVTLQINEYIH